NPKDMLSLHKSIRHYVGSCYCHVTLTCMKMMAELAREQKKLIVYFIEDGNEYAGELRHFLNQIKENPTLVEIYAMAGADTYKKQDVIQLQAADLHAWSFGRSHYRRRWEKGLVELVKDGTLRHTMGKYDPMMFSLFNSFYGLRSNRKTFDYEKQKQVREVRPDDGTDEGSPQRKKNVI